MSFTYKKGWQLKNGTHNFCFAISSGKIESFRGGHAKEVLQTEDICEYIDFCKNNHAKKIALIDLPQKDFDFVIDELCDFVEEIELFYSLGSDGANHDKLSKCKNLKKVLIDCCRGTVNLWQVSDNKLLQSLEITGVERLKNQQGLKNAGLSQLVIKNRNSNLNDTKKPVIKDFSLFSTMPNLNSLELFVGKKSNKKDDLIALSGLKSIQKITLPKNYFTFGQFAWLSGKLPETKGIGCIKDQRWNKRIEKYEYTINGTRMAWEFKDYCGTGINKYLKKFDELVEKYKNDDNPPVDVYKKQR